MDIAEKRARLQMLRILFSIGASLWFVLAIILYVTNPDIANTTIIVTVLCALGVIEFLAAYIFFTKKIQQLDHEEQAESEE